MTPNLSGVSEDVRRLNPELYGGAQQAPVPDDAASDERKLHYAIIEHCKQRKWIYLHGSMAQPTARTVGEPDFTILADRGRVFFIEAKTAIGKLSPSQLALKVWAEQLGHTIHVVRSLKEFYSIVE